MRVQILTLSLISAAACGDDTIPAHNHDGPTHVDRFFHGICEIGDQFAEKCGGAEEDLPPCDDSGCDADDVNGYTEYVECIVEKTECANGDMAAPENAMECDFPELSDSCLESLTGEPEEDCDDWDDLERCT